ncbi:thioredoxin [Halopseudomonas aestusnigri]|uniref:Thioredoxin n=1 Tax=Halopseudomonas aestusnigri TaxID=857252 RepID=A0AAQ1JRF5_9GAMM|nr:thioredoxin [Halopseudomonas aestusnigri]OWL84694.1 thioredoxin [Halopseudomonas aestusnigri]SEG68161.1 thioredoxin [Halopseudomonas aestusnigri]
MSSPYLFDATTDTFDRYVLENSFHKPVLVDFWADWCAPCKALFPVLEKIVDSYEGELLLAKVNCDAEPGLTERFGIRSLPTVVLFKDGQPVEGFAGVQPEGAIRDLLAPHVNEPAAAAEAPEEDLAAQAQALIDAGQPQQAIALLQPALQAETDDALLLVLTRALLADGQLDDADKVINAVQNKDSHKQTLSALKAQLSFARQSTGFAPRAALQARLDADAADSEARYQLALLDLTAGHSDNALTALLELLQRDRSWNDGAAQKTLLQVFDLLGGDHPLTVQYRRKLYQALY